MLFLILRVLVFLTGVTAVFLALRSAVLTFVLPRASADELSRFVFAKMRWFFNLRVRRQKTYLERDRTMALFAPVSLLTLPVVWLTIVLLGYMGMYWAFSEISWGQALRVSGSSLLTLGFAVGKTEFAVILTFTEAAIGLILAALLISYLPTMYSSFSRREAAVTLMEVRAGSPPSAVILLARHHRIGHMERLGDLWSRWEEWFAELEETHTSLAALNFFRSPNPNRSWVTAAGAVLDAAALHSSTLDLPHEPYADLCLRAGSISLRNIAVFFGIPHHSKPRFPEQSVSVTREEYETACDTLIAAGVPLRVDREQSWLDFAGWRVNYDEVLLALADITMAPPAPWSSDRAAGITRMSAGELPE
jgi:hypothetical protein